MKSHSVSYLVSFPRLTFPVLMLSWNVSLAVNWGFIWWLEEFCGNRNPSPWILYPRTAFWKTYALGNFGFITNVTYNYRHMHPGDKICIHSWHDLHWNLKQAKNTCIRMPKITDMLVHTCTNVPADERLIICVCDIMRNACCSCFVNKMFSERRKLCIGGEMASGFRLKASDW